MVRFSVSEHKILIDKYLLSDEKRQCGIQELRLCSRNDPLILGSVGLFVLCCVELFR